MSEFSDHRQLVAFAREYPSADMYRDLWGDAKRWEELPPLTREYLARTPLAQRRYKDGKMLVKNVRANQPFLSEWLLDDIKKELFGVKAARPMVYFRDAGETLEKALWCHLHGMTRIIGEENAAVSLAAARAFRIDSFIGDAESLEQLAPYLGAASPLASITIIGVAFDVERIRHFAYGAARVRFVVALPETGAFAETDLTRYPECDLLPDALLESDSDGLLLTKLRLLVTPIIRYRIPLNGRISSRDTLVL